ncbi:hypothetical protein HDK90DRAFT_85394 [Phyllosticta capitalensis]|uniref:Uncharacterized protein n=1 Tax=Phyllosticta capitalensis TaxID=121624 RepID=A0ABR1YAX1_9PEZI
MWRQIAPLTGRPILIRGLGSRLLPCLYTVRSLYPCWPPCLAHGLGLGQWAGTDLQFELVRSLRSGPCVASLSGNRSGRPSSEYPALWSSPNSALLGPLCRTLLLLRSDDGNLLTFESGIFCEHVKFQREVRPVQLGSKFHDGEFPFVPFLAGDLQFPFERVRGLVRYD